MGPEKQERFLDQLAIEHELRARIKELESPWIDVNERLPTEEECRGDDGWHVLFAAKCKGARYWKRVAFSPNRNGGTWTTMDNAKNGKDIMLVDTPVTHWRAINP